MNILLFLLTAIVLLENSRFPYPEFVMTCYPKTMMPGDTLYVKIIAKNHHAESIYISDNFLPICRDIQIHLRDSEKQTYLLFFEAKTNKEFSRGLWLVEIKPGDSRTIAALTINVPSLEDLKEPFWEKHLKNFSVEGVKFSLCATIISYAATNKDGIGDSHDSMLPFTLETPIKMKPHLDKEMTLIREWCDNTPNDWFPVPDSDRNPTRKVPPRVKFQRINNTLVKGHKVSHWYFVPIGNRYPGHPNTPETWQGWKELEESLTPSTMRDEIRLTRILIQYCDTEDGTVLKELKDWFDGMNEIQRTVMAKSLRDRAAGCYGNNKLLPPFREIYKAIREYDIVPVPESNVKHLRDLGLIE